MDYELFISRASPYSSKILALMGYSGLRHRIRIQNAVTRYTVIKKLTGKTMVPVLRRGQWAISDSTRIARYIMRRTGRPTLPANEGEALAWFIEDFADEWMVRWMVHSRWRHSEDAERISEIIGRELTGPVPVGSKWIGRQVARLLQQQMKAWGVCAENDRALESSALRCLEALEAILSQGPNYLFGEYPTVADFSVYGALVQYQADPTGRQKLAKYTAVGDYVRRIDAMADRPPTVTSKPAMRVDLQRLQPLFAELLGTYWSVLIANYQTRIDGGGRREMVAELVDGSQFQVRTSGYLQGRLQTLLELVDRTYATRDHLFGTSGLRMERALVDRIAELCESEAGRQLLREYKYVGMH